MAKKIIGITACPAGIAHTYMAANNLEEIGIAKGHTVRIEKQGSLGVEDELTAQEIAEADLVIIAVNKTVDLDRFVGKMVYQTSADHAMKNKEDVLEKAISEARVYGVKGTTVGDGAIMLGSTNNAIMNHIMAGLSYMIPMVVAAGMMMAISGLFAIQRDEFGNVTGEWGFDLNNPWEYLMSRMNQLGSVGFMLMTPLFAGFVANSIGGLPAIAAAMIGTHVANDPAFLGTQSGGGFFAAIAVALCSGYIVKYLKQVKWPSFLKPILGIMVFPILSTLGILLIVVYGIGKPIASLMYGMHMGLNYLIEYHPNSKFLIGAVMGAMMGFDFGGPVNKTSLLFGMGIMSDSMQEYGFTGANFMPDTANNAAIPIAPLGIWLASVLFKKYFSTDEHTASKAAMVMAINGISEGAIPFACRYPLQTIVASVIGSGLAGGISYSLELEKMGGFTILFPLMVHDSGNLIQWWLTLAAGIITTALIIGFWRKLTFKLDR